MAATLMTDQRPKTDSSDEPIIEMKNVAVSSQAFPDKAVVEGINWTVGRGEYWVIGGLHSSGKTDLLATTAGLLPPLSGSYLLFGNEMPIFEEHLLKERLRLGLVFESGQLLHNLTIRQNVALPLRYHQPRAEAREITAMLELTGLHEVANNLPPTVGRSWHKRAGLARALVMKPEILLVDNPLNGLDPRHWQWWIDFLRQLSAGHECMKQQPLTLIMTAEDLRPWRNFGAHFAILQDGRFTSLGKHDDIAAENQPLVKELLYEH
jgi:phospholipid/cholesterol/gamma-HCH transport system ATP-binding protein